MHVHHALWLAIAAPLCAQSSPLPLPREPVFAKLALSREFTAEGACVGDVDRDGQLDVQSGPYWYKGPELELRSEIYPPRAFDPAVYSDHFQSWAQDFDGDGWTDVLIVGFPGRETHWFKNPQELARPWERSLVLGPIKKEMEDLEEAIARLEQSIKVSNEALVSASCAGDASRIAELSRSVRQAQARIDQLFERLVEVADRYESESRRFEAMVAELEPGAGDA
jgi:hypothetical protein